MDNDKPRGKSLFSKLTGKLAVLLGSGLAILNGASTLDANVTQPNLPSGMSIEVPTGNSRARSLSPKLVLKQSRNGVRLVQQHTSHDSHSSHDSHNSHSSHHSTFSPSFVTRLRWLRVSDETEGVRSELLWYSALRLDLDPRIYSREAVLKASYWFTKIAYIRIPESADSTLAIQIELKQIAPSLANPNPTSIQQFTKEFCNSLLDFELRRQVKAETAAVRQLIVAKAFSELRSVRRRASGHYRRSCRNAKTDLANTNHRAYGIS